MELNDVPVIVCLLSSPVALFYSVRKQTGSSSATLKEMLSGIFYLIPATIMGGIHVAIPAGAVMVVVNVLCAVLGLRPTPDTLAILATLAAFAFWPINFKLMRSK